MLTLFHPSTWKINDKANPIPPSVPLFPHWWMNLKQLENWARPCILLPPLAAFIGKSKNCQFDIYSWSALGGWKKSYFLSLSLSSSLLTVTPLDFRNLRPGVKMAASFESAHPGRLPQHWSPEHAGAAGMGTGWSFIVGVRALVQSHCNANKSGWCRNTASQKIN